jgi:rubrerythrin
VSAEGGSTRRELLSRGLALGGGATVSASTIPILLGAREAFAAATGDAAILAAAIGLEQLAISVYGAAVKGGVLGAEAHGLLRRLIEQERAHAAALAVALRRLGGSPPRPPATIATVDRRLGSAGIATRVADLRSEADILAFAVELEEVTIAAYYDAHRKLSGVAALTLATEIMANEGQHATVLRMLRSNDIAAQVPAAIEVGRQHG